MGTPTIYTIGHSTHPTDEFIEILQAHGIGRLVDVRTIPKSRRNPQFWKHELAGNLRARGITYRHVKALGGLRHRRQDSPNGAWRNTSFQGYADHMLTDEFNDAVADLLERGHNDDLVIMCAEAVPWRCHRSLIGDALLVRGAQVMDIFSATNAKPHTLTSFAHVQGTRITYPKDAASASEVSIGSDDRLEHDPRRRRAGDHEQRRDDDRQGILPEHCGNGKDRGGEDGDHE